MGEANHLLEQNNATKLLWFNPMDSLAQATYKLLQTVKLSLNIFSELRSNYKTMTWALAETLEFRNFYSNLLFHFDTKYGNDHSLKCESRGYS